MATEQAKGISKPKDDTIPDSGQDTVRTLPEDEGDELANILGYRGPDGSKSLGYLAHPPVGDHGGLGTDADDAGRLQQEEGQNTGAGKPVPIEHDTAKAREADRAKLASGRKPEVKQSKATSTAISSSTEATGDKGSPGA